MVATVRDLFRFDGFAWLQKSFVKASNTEQGDQFGSNAAISADGEMIAIPASEEDSDADGINGDQTDNSAFRAGAVYIF